MKKAGMKKLLAVLLIALLSLTLFACGGNSGSSSGGNEPEKQEETAPAEEAEEAEEPAEPAEEAPAADAGEVIKIRLATGGALDAPCGHACVDFKEYLEEKSNGHFEVEIYDNASMGSDRVATESMIMGDLEMVTTVPFAMNQVTNYAPWLFFELPWVIIDIQDMYKVVDNAPQIQELDDYTAQTYNVRTIGWGTCGNYAISTAKGKTQPLTPDTLNGLKLRVNENKVILDFMEVLGVQTVVVSFTELYTAMQQGTMDGCYLATSLTYQFGVHELIDYMTVLNSGSNLQTLAIGEKFLQSLSAEDQALIKEAGAYWSQKEREYATTFEQDVLKTCEDIGVEIHYLTEEEVAAYQDAMVPVYERWSEEMGKEWYDGIVEFYNAL